MEDVERICATLSEFTRDDAEWPSSFVLRDAHGWKVDAHPLRFDATGDGWQAAKHRWPGEHLDARGVIGGREIRCITPELQLRWHEHDGFDDVDWQDVRTLAERFGLPLPERLATRPGFVHPKRTNTPVP
jgi:hypothetical protein